MAALREQRAELSNQITSATSRRNELAEQLENATGANRTGLEQRLGVLDERIVRLEKDIAETGRLLTAQYTFGTEPATGGRGLSSKEMSVSIVFTLFVLAPIAFAYARSIWKRTTQGVKNAVDPTEVTRRMTNLEQSIDAIAVEIERISEGQRYVTKMFSESRTPALAAGSGGAEPIRVGQDERVAIPRNDR